MKLLIKVPSRGNFFKEALYRKLSGTNITQKKYKLGVPNKPIERIVANEQSW